MTDWVKLRNKYINSTMSAREIAEKYGVPRRSVELKCAEDGWVEARRKHREKLVEKIDKKTAEKVAERSADNSTAAQDIAARLLAAVKKAVEELEFTELHQRRQVKRTKDLGSGEREEKTETKEYLERVACAVDMSRVNNITSALKNIMEINAMVGGENVDENKAFDDLMKAIGGLNETK